MKTAAKRKRRKWNTVILEGVPGRKGQVKAACSRSINDTMAALLRHRAVTSCGSNGALNVWKSDNRELRGEFYRYMITMDSQTFATKAQLRAWLKEWWPRLGRD